MAHDAFISYAHANSALARQISRQLEGQGLDIWLDESDIRIGSLLRDELRASILGSRTLILLWTEAAAASRWVAGEILTAFHLGRFIIPCVGDATPIPGFLDKAVYLDLSDDADAKIPALALAVRSAPDAPNELPRRLSSTAPEVGEAALAIDAGQQRVTTALFRRRRDKARALQRQLDEVMSSAEKRWPFESVIAALAGYHRKNAVTINHWDAIQAGRTVSDPLLLEADRCFLDALLLNPNDYNALNGLGSVLILEQDLDTAEFFIRRAIAVASQGGLDYSAAEHDLAMLDQSRAP